MIRLPEQMNMTLGQGLYLRMPPFIILKVYQTLIHDNRQKISENDDLISI